MNSSDRPAAQHESAAEQRAPSPGADASAISAIYTLATDRELVARILGGDAKAQETFVVRFQRLVHALLHRRAFKTADHEDVYQQVFLHLWSRDLQCLRQWDGQKSGDFRGYLRVIVERIALDHLRRQNSRRQREKSYLFEEQRQFEGVSDFTPHLIAAARRQAIDQALSALPPRDAEMLRLRYFEEQSYGEIAQHLSLTVNHVGVALGRAQRRLARRLRQGGLDAHLML